MYSKSLSIADFAAEKRALEEYVPDVNVWKGLAIWINTFAGVAHPGFCAILMECYEEEKSNENHTII